MNTGKTIKILAAATCALLCLVAFKTPLLAQEKLQNSPGGYHGEMDFPLSFKHYYTHAEWSQILRDLQKKYPHLADIQSIGKSRMGREQLLLTITAKSTGKAETKPAMWVDGAIHGNEINGVTCSLYLAWYLLTRYDYDSSVKNLVDSTTFYILPGLNVDGNDNYASQPNTADNPREPFRPVDDDGDGLFDEDRSEDVNGDGEISNMYIEDPKGNLKLSPDKRRFVAIEDPKEEVKRFGKIGMEGYDNDGDGMVNEDDIGGLDPNRNFPFGWNLDDGYPYPLSEPETRNVFEFQLAHNNIYATFHYHNTGRMIMFQAPLVVKAPNVTPEQRQRQIESFNNRLAEMRKTNKYAQAFDRKVAPELQGDMDVQTDIVTMGARILKEYRPVLAGLAGQAHAATYNMLGAYSYLVELWGSPVAEADIDGDNRVSNAEYMKWIDIELMGEGWITPKPFIHPDLGEVWIGGTEKKHITRTPPSRYMEQEAMRNTNFVLYCASQFPKVEIDEVKITPATDDLYLVEVLVTNDRAYPTSSDRAVTLKINVPDRITLKGSEGVTCIEMAKGGMFDPTNQSRQADAITKDGSEFRLKAREAKRFVGLVKMTGTQGWIEVQVTSKAGGKAVKRINIKVN